jgi:hypothetical protein
MYALIIAFFRPSTTYTWQPDLTLDDSDVISTLFTHSAR